MGWQEGAWPGAGDAAHRAPSPWMCGGRAPGRGLVDVVVEEVDGAGAGEHIGGSRKGEHQASEHKGHLRHAEGGMAGTGFPSAAAIDNVWVATGGAGDAPS